MIGIGRDRKSGMWVITRTDGEGFHHQLMVTDDEMETLVSLFEEMGYGKDRQKTEG